MLDRLPAELLTSVAKSLHKAKDLDNFARVCKVTYQCFRDDSALWLAHVRREFDVGAAPEEYPTRYRRRGYQRRMRAAEAKFQFRKGISRHEQSCLHLLGVIIVESFAGAVGGARCSKNLAWIAEFCKSHQLFDSCLLPKYVDETSRELIMVQVALSHLRFQETAPRSDHNTLLNGSLEPYSLKSYSFPESQREAYEMPCRQQLFTSKDGSLLEVNIAACLHIINFWHFHLTDPYGWLVQPYDELDTHLKIAPWQERIRPGGNKVGRRYLGDFSWLDPFELSCLRKKINATGDPLDLFRGPSDGDAQVFQSLSITYLDGHKDAKESAIYWPPLFERHLQAHKQPAVRLLDNLRVYQRQREKPWRGDACGRERGEAMAELPPLDPWSSTQQFTATGCDHGEPFFATGWITPLGYECCELIGFQRFVMVKFFPHHWHCINGVYVEGTPDPPSYSHILRALASPLDENLYGYEGLVLPGGHMIVGRWFDIEESTPDGAGLGLTGEGRVPVAESEELDDLETWSRKMASGPFVFWCTDRSGDENKDSVDCSDGGL